MPCAVFRCINISCDRLCWATMVSDSLDRLSNQFEILPVCWVFVATTINSFYCRQCVRGMPGDTQSVACTYLFDNPLQAKIIES